MNEQDNKKVGMPVTIWRVLRNYDDTEGVASFLNCLFVSPDITFSLLALDDETRIGFIKSFLDLEYTQKGLIAQWAKEVMKAAEDKVYYIEDEAEDENDETNKINQTGDFVC